MNRKPATFLVMTPEQMNRLGQADLSRLFDFQLEAIAKKLGRPHPGERDELLAFIVKRYIAFKGLKHHPWYGFPTSQQP